MKLAVDGEGKSLSTTVESLFGNRLCLGDGCVAAASSNSGEVALEDAADGR